MKHIKQHSLYGIVLVALCITCGEEERMREQRICCRIPPELRDNHYIAGFTSPNSVVADTYIQDHNSDKKFNEGDDYLVRFRMTEGTHYGIDPSSEEEDEVFRRLVGQLGDTTHSGPGSMDALLDTVLHVEITCDKAFDAEHPAGEDLQDFFAIEYGHAKFVIDNGYSYDFDDFDLPEGIEHVEGGRFRESLGNFNSHGEDNFPVSRRFTLYLEQPPAEAGRYAIRVRVRTSRGALKEGGPRETVSHVFEWQGSIPP